MNNFCTVCDFNFCDRVWALNHSLSKHSENYTLNVLCLDKKAKKAFDAKKQKNKKLLKSIECLTNKKTCDIEITKIVTQT